MDILNWSLYYKTHETLGHLTTTQMCYEPRVNPEGNIFCMNFCFPCDYQAKQQRVSYTKDVVDFAFEREVRYLEIFQGKPWIPEIINIENKKIFIRWNKNTCNDLIYREKNLDIMHPNWRNDIENIILDQINLGYYKATLYPHSHFYDKQGVLKSIDFYACTEIQNPYIEKSKIESLIGLDTSRFIDATEDNLINVETIFKSGILKYSKWPGGFDSLYRKIFNYE